MPDRLEPRGVRGLAVLDGCPQWTVWLAVAGTTGLIVVADVVTSAEMELGALYLLPIFLVTWRFGRPKGLLAAAFCAALWLGVDMVQRVYVSWTHELWNAVLQLATFVVFSIVSFAFRTEFEHHKQLALADPLTGAANRRAFEARAELEIARSGRTLSPLTLVLLDVDDFKGVNDRLGHPGGDRVLQEIVAAVRSGTRATDLVARVGGDEFGVLLSDTSFGEAGAALEKLGSVLLDRMRGQGWDVTVSVGAATFASPPASVSEMFVEADRLLYRAKNEGRNRTLHVAIPDAGSMPA